MAPGTNTEQTTAVETPNSTDPAYTGQAVGKCPFQVIQALVIKKTLKILLNKLCGDKFSKKKSFLLNFDGYNFNC